MPPPLTSSTMWAQDVGTAPAKFSGEFSGDAFRAGEGLFLELYSGVPTV